MEYTLEGLNHLHYSSLVSTNQKLYQLAEEGAKEWTVVSCDEQSKGKGYGNNVWLSEAYKNAQFSFLIRFPFDLGKDIPYLNMWIATQLVSYLSEWQVEAQVKWPNDIIVKNKKLAGILIENKIMRAQTKFCVIGLGINLNQTHFPNLPSATSLTLEKYNEDISVTEFIKELMVHYQKNFDMMVNSQYDDILAAYNNLLFKRGRISVFEWKNKKYNGIIKRILANGNIHIDLDEVGLREFRFKEIKMLY